MSALHHDPPEAIERSEWTTSELRRVVVRLADGDVVQAGTAANLDGARTLARSLIRRSSIPPVSGRGSVTVTSGPRPWSPSTCCASTRRGPRPARSTAGRALLPLPRDGSSEARSGRRRGGLGREPLVAVLEHDRAHRSVDRGARELERCERIEIGAGERAGAEHEALPERPAKPRVGEAETDDRDVLADSVAKRVDGGITGLEHGRRPSTGGSRDEHRQRVTRSRSRQRLGVVEQEDGVRALAVGRTPRRVLASGGAPA